MKSLLLSTGLLLGAFMLSAQITFACGDGSCDPDPEPEPPAVETPHSTNGGSDNDPVSTPTYYPCCIMNGGGIRPKWDLFRTPEQVIEACQRAIERGNANIYACGDDYIAPLK